MYTTEETLAFLDNRDHRDTIKDQNIAIIMQGTNDIRGSKGRRESNGSEAFHNLSDAAKTINRLSPKVLATQIPPMTKPKHDIETSVLNTRLESIESKYFTTIKTNELRRNPKEKILENDGFHLTDLEGKIVAEAINKATKTTKNQEKTDLTIHKIEIPKEKTGYVIGKQGKTIQALKEKQWQVAITTENRKDGIEGMCVMAVKGTKAHTEEATAEIHQILRDAERDLRRKLEQKQCQDDDKKTCRLFLRGTCVYGLRCCNAHPADPTQHQPSTSSQGQQPKRQRSTSRPRSPLPTRYHYHQDSPHQRPKKQQKTETITKLSNH